MAEKIVSPGVFTRERNQTFLIQGVSQIGAAIVGPFKEGPVFSPTVITSQADLTDIFGVPDGTYYTPYTAQDYLRNSGVVTVVRTGGLGGYNQLEPIILKAEQDGTSSVVAVLANSKEGGSVLTGFTSAAVSGTSGANFSATAPFVLHLDGSSPYSSSLDPASPNYIKNVFGGSPYGTNDAYLYKIFETTIASMKTDGGAITMSVETPADTTLLFEDDAIFASTPWIKSQLIATSRFNLFRIHTMGDGNSANSKFKIAIENVKAAGTIQGTDFGSFDVIVREFDDTDKRQVVVESFKNANLDSTSPNYISRLIGDRYLTISSTGKITKNGDWDNNSKNIRVEVSPVGAYPDVATPVAFAALSIPVNYATASDIPAVSYKTTLGADDRNYGFNFSSVDSLQYVAPIPSGSGAGSNTDFSLDTLVGLNVTSSLSTDVNARKFIMPFQGGFDGMAPNIPINLGSDISATNSQGFDLSASTSSGSIAYQRAFDALSNADEFDINMLLTPGVVRRLHPSTVTAGIDLCEAREDAFYIADFNGPTDTITQALSQANSVDSNYVATYFPWIKIVDANTNQKISVPPSVLMAGVFAANDRVAAEWWAPAGLNRGGLTQATDVLSVLTRAERDDLYDGKVNPIASFPGQGIVAWGQKTLQTNQSALDRINVRRLLINLKKYIASTTKYLVFEQNTATTRNRFLNIVNPYLESVQQRQGLSAFRVVMDESNNTPDIIDRNILYGQIFIQPTRTAEFIVIDFNIQPTGASFDSI